MKEILNNYFSFFPLYLLCVPFSGPNIDSFCEKFHSFPETPLSFLFTQFHTSLTFRPLKPKSFIQGSLSLNLFVLFRFRLFYF